MKKKYFILVILLVACVSIPLTTFLSKKENVPAPENKELPESAPITFKDGEFTEYQNDIPASEMVLTEEQKEYLSQNDLFYYDTLENEWKTRQSMVSRSICGSMRELKNGQLISFLENNADKNIPFNKLIVNDFSWLIYDFRISKHFCTYKQYGETHNLSLSSVIPSLDIANDNGLPIEYINKIDNNFVYVVYKSNYEGKDVYFYLITAKYLSSEGIVPGYYEDWLFLGESYFVSGSYCSDDFKDVKIGDSIEDVIEIDSSIKCDILHSRFKNKTYRLLEDGMLKISFEDDKVSAIEFHPYGDIYSNDSTEVFNILRAEKPVELPKN